MESLKAKIRSWAKRHDLYVPIADEMDELIEITEMAAIEGYITDNYGPRCKTKDIEDFPNLGDEPEESRCAGCRAWDHYDEWRSENNKEKV